MIIRYPISGILLFISWSGWADQDMDQCLLKYVKDTTVERSATDIRAFCEAEQVAVQTDESAVVEDGHVHDPQQEPYRDYLHNIGLDNNFERFALQARPANFAMPVYATNKINPDAYTAFPDFSANFADIEAKFQLNIRHALNEDDIFFHGDGFYFAFTNEAWWQLYSDNVSKPFRETNYKPEVYYMTPTIWQPYGGNTAFAIGAEHQSNGRSQLLSRSWNRVYAQFMFAKDDWAVTFKPWWRLPEDDKAFEGDPKGDDNPDIRDFMGHFELYGRYDINDEISTNMMFRRNFSTGKGAVELGLTFPTAWVNGLEWYFTFFDGYGDSLIDYNHKQTRFGVGLAIRD